MIDTMNWKNPRLRVLGLESKEKDLLTLLSDSLSIQDVSRKSPIPRTTITYMLKKLVERGLVEKVRFGKRYRYYSVPAGQLQAILGEATASPFDEPPTPSAGAVPSSTKKISNYRGLKNITQLQVDFLQSHRDERVYAIQPNKSWLSLHSKVSEDQVIRVNEIIRNNNLIIDAVIEHDAYENFRRANQSKRKFLALAKSFGDRMADYVSAPKGYMTDQVEMWIIKNTALFIDWREEVAIKIVDAHMAHFLKDMYLLTKEHGKKIDHNQAIREVAK